MKRTLFYTVVCLVALLAFSSCLSDEEKNANKYADWRETNESFVQNCELEMDSIGNRKYTRIVPLWSPSIYVLMKWHNDRTLTEKNLVPLANSTVDVVYQGRLYDGAEFDNSFSQTDSVYRTKPYLNVAGFWTALSQMHVGDSVTVVIPWQAGYGATGNSSIKPYSALVFDLKLKAIPHYQTES